MKSPKVAFRRWLARRGYVIDHVESGVRPTIANYLRTFQTESASMQSIVCMDNSIGLHEELLEAVPDERVRYVPPTALEGGDCGDSPAALAPTGDFAVVIDADMFSVDRLFKRMPWLKDARAVLLRVRCGSVWSGRAKISSFMGVLSREGFRPVDVLGALRVGAYEAASASIVFAFEPSAAAVDLPAAAKYRVNEAMAHLDNAIALYSGFRFLAGRGSFGFPAGIFNPCATTYDGVLYVLARADRTPWCEQKKDETQFFSSTRPFLFNLGDGNRTDGARELAISGFLDARTNRAEDFRMFQFREMIFSNHAVISLQKGNKARNRALRMDLLETRVGISRLNPVEPSLTWCGFPTLDRPTGPVEKNWAMFSDGQRLFLLYSFEPYVLLEAADWPDLEFETVLETSTVLPFGGDGVQLRNSINPVDYDANHWLHIVHKAYPGKRYVFWAVLIDKRTLLPVKVSGRPLVSGWQSAPASIIYICSAVVSESEVRLFGGLDDSSCGSWTVSRSSLDECWTTVAERRQPATAQTGDLK